MDSVKAFACANTLVAQIEELERQNDIEAKRVAREINERKIQIESLRFVLRAVNAETV